MAPGHRARTCAVLVGGATVSACCTFAALSGSGRSSGAGRPSRSRGLRLFEVTDWLPRGLAVVGASVAGVLVLVLVLVVALLAALVRALWLLLRRLWAALRQGPVPGSRGRPARTAWDAQAREGITGEAPAELDDRALTRHPPLGAMQEQVLPLRQDAPRDASHEIVRCWEAIERTVVDNGRPRLPSDTPTEFSRVVLTEFRVDAVQLAVLLDVYGRARFSRRPLDPADLDRARAAFDRLRRDLTGTPVAR